MGIIWKDVFTRFKGKPTEEDLFRSALGFGKVALKDKTIAPYLEALTRIDSSRDWITEWKSTLLASIVTITQGQTRDMQAKLCRREILAQIESCSISKLLFEFDDEQIRTYLLKIQYAECTNLNDQGKFNLLVIRRTFALLRQVSLIGLYLQQYNQNLNEQEFSQPYQLTCEAYCEILLKSLLSTDEYILANHPAFSLYTDMVANPFIRRFREAKESFAETIVRGNSDEFHIYKASLVSLFEEYGNALNEFTASSASVDTVSPVKLNLHN